MCVECATGRLTALDECLVYLTRTRHVKSPAERSAPWKSCVQVVAAAVALVVVVVVWLCASERAV